MTPNQGSWFQGAAHTAQDDRRILAGLLPQGGVQAADDLLCSPGGLMTTSVAAGHVFIPGTTVSGQGTYHGYNDDAYIVNHDPADASPRVDTVVAKVDDNAVDLGGFNRWRIYVVKGSTVSYPSPAALPASAIPLAYVTIPNGTTTLTSGMYTDARARAAAPSGVIVCTSSARPTAYEGLLIYETDTDKVARYDGSNWRYLLDRVTLTNPADHDVLVYDGTVWRNEPLGMHWYDNLTSDTGMQNNTPNEINGLRIPAIPFVAGRKYRVEVHAALQISTGTGHAYLQARVNDVAISAKTMSPQLSSVTEIWHNWTGLYLPGTSGTREVSTYLESLSSGYNVKICATNPSPNAYIQVTDIGRA